MRSTAAKVLYGGAHGLHFITAQLHLSGTSVAAERLHAIGAPLCTAVTQDSSQRQEYNTTSCSSAIAADYVSHTQQLAITACQVSLTSGDPIVFASAAPRSCMQGPSAPHLMCDATPCRMYRISSSITDASAAPHMTLAHQRFHPPQERRLLRAVRKHRG